MAFDVLCLQSATYLEPRTRPIQCAESRRTIHFAIRSVVAVVQPQTYPISHFQNPARTKITTTTTTTTTMPGPQPEALTRTANQDKCQPTRMGQSTRTANPPCHHPKAACRVARNPGAPHLILTGRATVLHCFTWWNLTADFFVCVGT